MRWRRTLGCISGTTLEFNGTLEADDDTDYVKYENQGSGATTFRVLSTESDDLEVDVLDGASAEPLEHFSTYSAKSYTPKDGALWLKVFAASGKGRGNYTIRAEQTSQAAAR